MAQSIVRAAVGQIELQSLFENRNKINDQVEEEIKDSASAWGCNVLRFEVVSLEPKDRIVRNALHKRAVAEREKKEAILKAEA